MLSLIAIPTFQRGHQIGRAVAAALGQSQDDVTVAVIDDGSTDDSEAACRPWFNHPRFSYLRLGANTGTAGAKNAALALLPFDAITFHDSDDIPHVDKVLRQQAHDAAIRSDGRRLPTVGSDRSCAATWRPCGDRHRIERA